ncbi:protein FAM96B [Aspergillus sclerotiicarbonarius CBS 121057]|uniref:Protein FAM96B n=1 Tax=Aspergillus sclerotiicarbonarius (strain CBS 121057 / IBT 28362) TaxID=1448318 RepID=A0A319EIA6_ASPSB|nr:protein FAM96B [Aspergillus sclerotiicarbonarius CBS 121057]
MDSAMQNSNPTILNIADLPTRLRPASSRKSGTYRGGILALTLSSLADPTDLALSPYGSEESDDDTGLMEEPIDEQEIYDLVSTISDPEHPISLGALAVVSLPDISIRPTLPEVPSSLLRTVTVLITPTITHCSLATVIGLGVRVRLEQSLPPRFRVDVRIKEGTHSTADEVNKQLADKERVAAALENGTLMGVIAKMLETCQ